MTQDQPQQSKQKSAAPANEIGEPRARVVPGSKLRVDLSKHRADMATQRWYWVGVCASNPLDDVSIGGISFPRYNGRPVLDTDGKTRMVQVRGALLQLTSAQLNRIADALPYHVIRFRGPETGAAARRTDDQDVDVPMRKADLVKIPRDADGSSLNRYVFQQYDEPMADHVFIVLCQNQDAPEHSGHEPAPVSQTGIAFGRDM